VIATEVRNPPNWKLSYETEISKSSSAEEIVPRPGVLFVPQDHSNAFVLQKGESDRSAMLWFIQLTVSSTYEGKKAGYDLIRTVHNRILRDFPKADVGYLLICPYEHEEYVWEFDNPVPEEGHVFVQGFDLDAKFVKSS
jgi:hypothetical protein